MIPAMSRGYLYRSLVVSAIIVISGIFAIVVLLHFENTATQTSRHLPPRSSHEDCVDPLEGASQRELVVLGSPITEFYDEYDAWFAKEWECKTGERLAIERIYDVSGNHTRAVIAGRVRPDVIALSHPTEVDLISQETGVVPSTWREEFPYNSSPYYTTLVFAVREGNPKNIKTWADVAEPGIVINVSDPKLCGGGRWVYNAALGYAQRDASASAEPPEEYLADFYENVPVLYHDQVEASKAFLGRAIGDVLITYEVMVLSAIHEGKQMMEIVSPEPTIKIEMPVVVARKYAEERGNTEAASEYIRGLYEPDVQRLIKSRFMRTRTTDWSDLWSDFFGPNVFTREELFDDSASVEKIHLGDGGIFDTL